MTPRKPRFVGERQAAALKDVCQLVMGQSPSSESYNSEGEGLPFYQGNADFGEVSPTPRVWCTDPKKVADKGDILISVRAPIGAVNIANEDCCIGRGVAAIRPKDDAVSTEFLKHQLLASRKKLESMGTGSTFKAVGKKAMSEFCVSVYPKNVQTEIGHQLDWVTDQIKVGEALIKKLDQLVKSRFVEMFGDVSNYEARPLVDCVAGIESGKSPKCMSNPRVNGGPAVLKLSAISSGVYLEAENKALLPDDEVIPQKVVVDGDILLSRKNTPELVGRSVLVDHTDGNVMFPDIVFRMHVRPGVNAVYLSQLLSGPLFGSIRSLAHGSAKSMSNIPKSELAMLEIPLPPLELQQEFADFAAQVDKSRFVARQQIEKLQTLYDSLAQDYFGD